MLDHCKCYLFILLTPVYSLHYCVPLFSWFNKFNDDDDYRAIKSPCVQQLRMLHIATHRINKHGFCHRFPLYDPLSQTVKLCRMLFVCFFLSSYTFALQSILLKLRAKKYHYQSRYTPCLLYRLLQLHTLFATRQSCTRLNESQVWQRPKLGDWTEWRQLARWCSIDWCRLFRASASGNVWRPRSVLRIWTDSDSGWWNRPPRTHGTYRCSSLRPAVEDSVNIH